jgi:hypothetical protein
MPKGVITTVFHRILDLKQGWISIRPSFFFFHLQIFLRALPVRFSEKKIPRQARDLW